MAEEEEKEGGETKSSGGKKKLFIIIGAVVLLLAIGGGAFFAMSGKKAPEGEEGAEEADAAEEEAGGAEGEKGELPGAIMPLDTFIVNLQVKGSFLKATINLEFAEPELPATVENDTPKIRDGIIRIMSVKTANDILSKEGKEKLAEEVKKVVNEVLESEDVVKVYFTEFIVQ